MKQTKELLQWILDCDTLSFEDKCELLFHQYSYEGEVNRDYEWFKQQSARKACEYGYGSIVLRFLSKDRRIMMKFLNPENIDDYQENKTPLMVLVGSDFIDDDALRIIFEESALNANGCTFTIRP